MFTTRLQIQEALSRVGRRLALVDAGEYALLICGGSALNLAGLADRPTRDVDVLGLVKGTEEASVAPEPLPEEVLRAAHLVAVDFNLPVDWLNDSALAIHHLGLPVGLLQRAQPRGFGPCLTVYVIGRQDQVALKLYAAIDRQKGRRHLEDLAAIEPTRSEMEFAVNWLLNRRTSSEFRHAIRTIAEALGFRNLPGLLEPEREPPANFANARAQPQPRRKQKRQKWRS